MYRGVVYSFLSSFCFVPVFVGKVFFGGVFVFVVVGVAVFVPWEFFLTL